MKRKITQSKLSRDGTTKQHYKSHKYKKTLFDKYRNNNYEFKGGDWVFVGNGNKQN